MGPRFAIGTVTKPFRVVEAPKTFLAEDLSSSREAGRRHAPPPRAERNNNHSFGRQSVIATAGDAKRGPRPRAGRSRARLGCAAAGPAAPMKSRTRGVQKPRANSSPPHLDFPAYSCYV